MTDNEQINKEIDRILGYISDAETSIDYARDEIQDLIDIIKVTEEVEDFLQEIMDYVELPEEVRNKAGELWRKV